MHIVEFVGLETLHHVGIEGIGLACRSEGAVIEIAPGASGDLTELGWIQIAIMEAVEFARCCEGDMIDIHVEAHADGIGRHQIVDIARLEQ